MNPDDKHDDEMSGELPPPANPGAREKAELPDPDLTDPATLPTAAEEEDLPLDETRFGPEHHISADHAEPTDVTRTSNDNYIEGEYIDVGGGD